VLRASPVPQPTSTPRAWATVVALATAVAFGVKLYISYRSFGTVDVAYWQLYIMGSHLGSRLYTSEIFNHPPAMLHVLPLIGGLAERSGLPFPFCLRLPGIIADVGSVWLVWRITQSAAPRLASPAGVLLMAIAPASLMISGYHGNTDPVMIFFVLLAVHLRESAAAWAAGIALGMAMNVKVVPLIFAPALLLYRHELRRGLALAVAAAATFLIASMPYLLDDPRFILQRVFGYSPSGSWGIPLLIGLAEDHLRFPALYSETWSGVPGVMELYAMAVTAAKAYAQWAKFLALGAIVLAAHRMNRMDSPPALFVQCGVAAFLFLFFSPGFGIQYLAWLVPWPVAAGPLVALIFYAISGEFLYRMYTTNLVWSDATFVSSFACWLATGLVLVILCRHAAVAAGAWASLRQTVGGWHLSTRLAAAAAGLLLLIGFMRASARALAATPGFLDRTFVTASSSYGNDGAFPPAATVDGRSDVNTWADRGGWSSAGTPTDDTPEYLTFMFATDRTIRHITLYSYPDPEFTLRGFVFQYRTDREWRDIEATRVRDNFEATRWSFEVPRTVSRQIRLLIFGSADRWARVMEVEFSDTETPRAASAIDR